MTEKQSGDPFEDAPDPTHKDRPFSLAALIIGLVALLLLVLALIFSVISPTVFVLISTLGVVLQLPSMGKRIETAVKHLHNYLDKRSQRLADMLGELWKKRWVISTIISSLIILSLFLYIFLPLVLPTHIQQTTVPKRSPSATTTPTPISVVRVEDGAYVGLSSGLTNFDTKRADGDLKDEAAQSLKKNDTNAAKGYWQLAIREDETDAEACIYQENQNALDSSSTEYVTIVVVVTLTGNDQNAINVGRSILQGACVAQKEYNSQHKLPGNLLVRLLIANVDDSSIHADQVAKQIKEAATNDTTTIAGVVGQFTNSDDAILELGKADIPMISSTPLHSTTETSYLFSVAPSIQSEAEFAAQVATKRSKQVALFYDLGDDYSKSLALAFESQVNDDGGHIAAVNTYTTGQAPRTLPDRINAVMSSVTKPDLIYLAGYPDDVQFLIPYVHKRWPSVLIMGGDTLYQYVHSYTSSTERSAFNNLLFTSFAFHEEWRWKGLVAKKPAFFDDYAQDFDSQKQHAGNPYGYLFPDSDTILSYDAINVFLKACSNVLTKEPASLTPQTTWKVLHNNFFFSGVSGQISFGSDGEPVDKAIVLLQVLPAGTNLLDVQGRYP